MNLLTAKNIEKSFGADTLFSGLNFQINEGEKIGLIGANGCGKTTLFRIITGEQKPTDGTVQFSKIAKVGYMEQHVSDAEIRTAYESVLDVFAHIRDMEIELDQVNHDLEQNAQSSSDVLDALIKRQYNLHESLEQAGFYTYKSRARATLLGLGFSDEMMEQSVSTMSGGEKAKVSLARLLLSQSNLLLLDEPTNHLDMPSVAWLEDFLRSYNGAVMVISHDRYFLDRVTNRTFEIHHHKLTSYDGNYTTFKNKKEAQQESIERNYYNVQKEIKRLEGVVEQQRRWNRERNIRMAESKEKQIERLKKDLIKPDSSEKSLSFSFPNVPATADDVLSIEHISKSFDHEPLFSDISCMIYAHERVFLIGPNGCGKSTLLKILTKRIQPDSGVMNFGTGVSVGYYDQTHSHLNSSKTILEEINDSFPAMTQGEIRNALASFLFTNDDVFKTIDLLSGGEKARVSLLKLMLSQANFLLLDEPTNHLDIQSREALESALLDYTGTLMVVSHDRYFINTLATRILSLHQHPFVDTIGNYDDYLAYLERQVEMNAVSSTDKKTDAKAVSETKNDYKKNKELRKQVRSLESKIRQYEKALSETDDAIAKLESYMAEPDIACDYQKSTECAQELALLHEKNDENMEQWLLFSEELAQLEITE